MGDIWKDALHKIELIRKNYHNIAPFKGMVLVPFFSYTAMTGYDFNHDGTN